MSKAPGTDSKNIISGIIRWAVVTLLLIIVYFWKKEMIIEAVHEAKKLPASGFFVCAMLSFLYFVFEGLVISAISREGDFRFNAAQGLGCSLYHAFYKFVTMGVVSGVAEIFYIHSSGATYSKACGMSLIRYTFQRMAGSILGMAGVLIAWIRGYGLEIRPVYIILGAIVSSTNSFMLFALSYSSRFAAFLTRIVDVLFGKREDKRIKITEQIRHFNSEGKILWKDKRIVIKSLTLSIMSLLMWMMIPAVLFGFLSEGHLVVDTGLMSVVNMLAGVMISPSGVGTMEYLFTVFFKPGYGILATTALILYRFYTLILPCVLGIVIVVKSHCTTNGNRI